MFNYYICSSSYKEVGIPCAALQWWVFLIIVVPRACSPSSKQPVPAPWVSWMATICSMTFAASFSFSPLPSSFLNISLILEHFSISVQRGGCIRETLKLHHLSAFCLHLKFWRAVFLSCLSLSVNPFSKSLKWDVCLFVLSLPGLLESSISYWNALRIPFFWVIWSCVHRQC